MNQKGQGPAWENSLFEDAAEFGYGMGLAVAARQNSAETLAKELTRDSSTPAPVATAAKDWLKNRKNPEASLETGSKLAGELASALSGTTANEKDLRALLSMTDLFGYKTDWCVGGDGGA